MTQLHLKGERLYNKEGVYETDVDHLAEIYKNLYHKVKSENHMINDDQSL